MAEVTLPLQTVILEDDVMARRHILQLLGRDLRTEVMAAFADPHELLEWLTCHGRRMPHVFVIDPEYDSDVDLVNLVYHLRELAPEASVLILSLYRAEDMVEAIVIAGVDGIVIKKEIGLAVATAVYLAQVESPVYSSALEPLLTSLTWNPVIRKWVGAARKLPRWRLHPKLSPRQLDILWHCTIYGMNAEITGEELTVATGTVEKYRSHLYDKLEDLQFGWIDWGPLKPIMHRLVRKKPQGETKGGHRPIYHGDNWAFHLLTALPRVK